MDMAVVRKIANIFFVHILQTSSVCNSNHRERKNLDIQELRAFQVPNVFSLREPIVKMKIDLGEYAETPTKDIDGMNEKILQFFPGVRDHKCATGYVGGFVDRLGEGTYLAHVTEHLSLELQRILGYDLRYGKARQIEGSLYQIIFACQHPEVGKACGRFIVDVLNRLVNGQELEWETRIREMRNLCARYNPGPSTGAILEEAKKRGIPVSELGDGEIIRLGYGKYQKQISATLYEGTSSIAVDIACNKALTKEILKEAVIPVPEGRVCMSVDEVLLSARELGYPVVIKPKSGNKGKFVYIGIRNDEELLEAYVKAATIDGEVVVEKIIGGRDYRLLVVNRKLVAAAERMPAHVVGDGVHTIRELIDEVNRDERRGEDHEKPLTRIQTDEETERILKGKELNFSSVVEKNQRVILRETANLSTGGEAYDCTDIVHPKNREIAELAARAVGLDIAGIDMVIPDIREPIHEGFGAVVEVNAAPGIRMHLYPTKGERRDVVSPILDMMYPEGTPCRIPIISITGTNGKTTTTRMISRILMARGLTVGTTTTHGIYINGNCVEEGDTTGPSSAKRILFDREVEAAVLETARGGIVRDGLAYEKADVAVFTNLTEDHLGIDGIHTMEELLKAKALVIEAVKENGTCVLNADDPWIMKAKERAKGNLLLFSMDENNPHILEQTKNRGSVVCILNDDIYLFDKGIVRRVMAINEIPATLNGTLKHNIYNSMAAIGASYSAGMPLSLIRRTLRTFSSDADMNPGRFNIYDLDDFKVVLDYGHNLDGYRVTIEGLKSMGASRLIGVIGVPGDRLNEDILRVGELSGKSFDSVIIKEDEELRGRRPLEVAGVLLEGVLNGGMDRERVSIITDEKQALQAALDQAEAGDIIVIFFEKREPLVEMLEGYRRPAIAERELVGQGVPS
jgi:cyanophycin synthetase